MMRWNDITPYVCSDLAGWSQGDFLIFMETRLLIYYTYLCYIRV
jgi:hypothetical protein